MSGFAIAYLVCAAMVVPGILYAIGWAIKQVWDDPGMIRRNLQEIVFYMAMVGFAVFILTTLTMAFGEAPAKDGQQQEQTK